MKEKCLMCGNDFEMGVDGTVDGCDSCQGIERDESGFLWFPTDYVHVYEEVETGKIIIVTREEAFHA